MNIDQLILNYLGEGKTQSEISNILKEANINPNSVSSIEKKLKTIRARYNAKTNFHLAVILKSINLI